ncbi:aldehyde dehydrogenase, partial [Bordetella bronchiseptica]
MTSSPDIGACAYIGGRWAQTPAARTFRTALPHDTRQSGREFGCATPADADKKAEAEKKAKEEAAKKAAAEKAAAE